MQIRTRKFPSFLKGKKIFLSFFFFVLLGTLFLPSFTYGQLGFLTGGIADQIGKAIGGIIARFWAAILTALLLPAAVILAWSIDPRFITVPYTHGGVVDVGWPVVRDFANMGIVLVLVAIGLATALRLQEYQARKTLPLLIAVALLINFTPVILGVIVDGANIFMNFFLDGLTGGTIIVGQFVNIMNSISGALSGFNLFDPIELLSFVVKLVIMTIFVFFTFIIFILFALLFIMRRVVIWLLVILSPLAFVAYILPATRSFSRMWWNQFVQWTIIGVFAAFFLWLGDHMIGLAARGGLTASAQPTAPFIGNPIADLLNEVLPIGIALIFLLIGFFVALSTSAMGAGGIMAGTQALGKAVPKVLGREAREKAGIMASEKFMKSDKARGISERMAMAKGPPKSDQVPIVGKVPVVNWAIRNVALRPAWAVGRTIGRTGVGIREAGLREITKKEEEAKKKWETPEMGLANIRSAATKTERVAGFNAAYEKGQLGHMEKLGFALEEREKIGREALEIHPQAFQKFKKAYSLSAMNIAKEFPEEIQERAGMTLSEEENEKYKGNILHKIMAEMKAEDVAKMAPSSIRSEEVKESIHAFWSGPQVGAAARAFGSTFVDTFNEGIKRRGKPWYDQNNPKLSRYLDKTPAQELGLMSPPPTGTEDVPGPQPPPPPIPKGWPTEGPSPPRGRTGPGIGPARPPRGRPGIGAEAMPPGEVPPRETIERLREEEERRPRGRPGIGV